jgi:hypothetical protein
MFYAAWEDKGEAVKKKLRNGGTGGTYIGDLLPHWPDTLHHATFLWWASAIGCKAVIIVN